MLLQLPYQIFAAYFTDDCADHLRKDPLFTRLVDKDVLASRPTLSRFWNRMDDSTLGQFLSILKKMRKAVYSVSMPREVILDLDSTLLTTYGQQESRRFNFHYQDSGYHPLLCYDGHTHDLIQIQLRTGNVFSSDGTVDFLQPVLNEYRTEYKNIRLKLRGDSGFAIPAIYDQAEDNDLSYAIRLKQNAALVRLHTRQEAGVQEAAPPPLEGHVRTADGGSEGAPREDPDLHGLRVEHEPARLRRDRTRKKRKRIREDS